MDERERMLKCNDCDTYVKVAASTSGNVWVCECGTTFQEGSVAKSNIDDVTPDSWEAIPVSR